MISGCKPLYTSKSLYFILPRRQTKHSIATREANFCEAHHLLALSIISQHERLIQEIGTYGVSILPDEDCCSLFVPKSPATRTSGSQVEAWEAELDVAGLVEEAVAGAELIEHHQGEPAASRPAEAVDRPSQAAPCGPPMGGPG